MARASNKRRGTTKTPNAVALLKADHRQVGQWFKEFENARAAARKKSLAAKICRALRVHMDIEENIFYPAFIVATKDKDMHHEAVVEHAGAKILIRQIEKIGPRDGYFDSKVHVLSEMIKHHVKEEEQRGGMFAEAKQSGMDLIALGGEMLARKKKLAAKA